MTRRMVVLTLYLIGSACFFVGTALSMVEEK